VLFNGFPFVLAFLPWALAGYWLLASCEAARLWFLLGASIVFYAYGERRFVPLLVGSILVNWLAVQAFFALRRPSVLVAAIAANLLCLAAFKYLGFFAGIVAGAGAGSSAWRAWPCRSASASSPSITSSTSPTR
jgi:alginate O-acetyltransferase complex protein AlgI